MTGMGCTEAESRLVDVVDGRLDPATSVRFHDHLEGCASCRERAAIWRALVPRMRATAPEAPDAMAARRMQIEVERQLASARAPAQSRRWRLLWLPALGVAATAVVIAMFRVGPGATSGAAAVIGYAAVARVEGAATVGGHAAVTAARVPVAAPIVVPAAGTVELALDGGATLKVSGPARVALAGGAHDVAVRLDEGYVRAEVTHRQPGDGFTVTTRDLRVVVRGTTFAVTARDAGSKVEVSEGRVEVRLGDDRTTFVSAGESLDTGAVVEPVVPAAPAVPVPGAAPPPSCGDSVRACQSTVRAVHAAMRASEAPRALRLIAEGSRNLPPGCAGDTGACVDELGYLRAEALNQAGRPDDAITAYRALDRRGAPPAMRQNALYAAAQIERRQGRVAEARADYERALAAASRGALREEALVGAMESAEAAGETTRARALAGRYLDEFPHGLALASARRLAGGGPHP